MPKIAGFDVEFPHQPYGVQYSFMAKVIQTVVNRENALLEAPTGSGKTLSLLCSSLAWQQKLKRDG
jgi:Fanconi anemia group J protein